MAVVPRTLNDRIVPQKIFKRRPANIGLLNHLTIRSFNQNNLLPELFNLDIDVTRIFTIFGNGAYRIPTFSVVPSPLCEIVTLYALYTRKRQY